MLLSTGYDKCIRFYDLETFSLKKTLNNVHNDCVISMCKLSNVHFASCSDDFTIKIWHVQNVKEVSTLKGHIDCVKCIDKVGDNMLCSGYIYFI
jgi:WD40 repeat protein